MKPSQNIFFAVALSLALVLCASCRTGPPLPPADLSGPGWEIHQGQAVWKPNKKRPELAGDLIFATNSNGNLFIQFTKTPFTLAEAQIMNGEWQMNFASGRYVFRAPGKPPKRFVWFQLPRALAGETLALPWEFTRKPDDSWRLQNPRTGESLEGVIFP